MYTFEDGLRMIDESCGHGKDTVISLSTIALGSSAGGRPQPVLRDVDALYEDGAFYIVTHALTDKMRQIAANPQVAFSVHYEGITGIGTGESLGWALEPRNAALREKLRATFADWYDAANNEQDRNCVFLAIRIAKASIFRDHGAVRFRMDFGDRTVSE